MADVQSEALRLIRARLKDLNEARALWIGHVGNARVVLQEKEEGLANCERLIEELKLEQQALVRFHETVKELAADG